MRFLLVLLLLAIPVNSFAEEEPAPKEIFRGPTLKLYSFGQEESASSEFKLNAKDIYDAAVFALDKPARVVIDIPRVRVATSQIVETSEMSPIRQIRIGKHSRKTRVVFDLDFDELPKYTWSASANELELQFPGNTIQEVSLEPEEVAPVEIEETEEIVAVEEKPAEAVAIQIPQILSGHYIVKEESRAMLTPSVIEEKVIEEPQEIAEVEPETVVEELAVASITEAKIDETDLVVEREAEVVAELKNEIEIPERIIVQEPAEVASVETAQPEVAAAISAPISEDDQKFLGVQFDIEDGDSQVKLSLAKRSEFQLVKKKAELYELVIPEAEAEAEHLLLPFFPPSTHSGFTYIHPKKVDDSIVVAIGVEKGSRAQAFTSSSGIALRIEK